MTNRIPKTKIAERLLTRSEGATMKEINKATGSDQYNVLRKLRECGHSIREVKEGTATRYFVVPPAALSFEVTVTSKGQVTIPVEVRDRLGVRSGGKLRFALEADDRVVMMPVDLSLLIVIASLRLATRGARRLRCRLRCGCRELLGNAGGGVFLHRVVHCADELLHFLARPARLQ